MVTDEQVRMLMTLINKEKTLAVAAAKAGMAEQDGQEVQGSGDIAQPVGSNTHLAYASGPI